MYSIPALVISITFSGRWTVVSQDSLDIYSCPRLAIIPFDSGSISIRSGKPRAVTAYNSEGKQSFSSWKWNDNVLTIQLTANDLQRIEGLVVER